MPYANNQGVRIYYEVEGNGPPLLLAHGMGYGGNLNAWRTTGYTQVLKDYHTLILFDFRGYGRSDKPHDSSGYESDELNDITAVLDSLDIEKTHYFGYSMGASAGFKQAVRHADRFYSFTLGGMTPGAWPEEMVKALEISAELAKLQKTDPEAYFVKMESLLKRSFTSEEKSKYLEEYTGSDITSPMQYHKKSTLTDEELAGISVPCLLYCGDLDPFHNGAQESIQHIPHATFVSMHGLNHISAFSRSDVVVPLVRQYLDLVISNQSYES